jgi:hypothetical protein
MMSIVNIVYAVPVTQRYLRMVYNYTAFRRFTPHHKTGARLVAQSNVNRLMNHVLTSTGTGARRTSVLLRKGRALRIVSFSSYERGRGLCIPL